MSIITNARSVEKMTDKLIRLHVVANSDLEYDQALKLKVRDRVLFEADRLTKDCGDKNSALEALSGDLDHIKTAAEEVLKENGCDLKVSVCIEKAYVNERVYDNFTLPSGLYDALCVRIGKAEGKNWWCVLYPSLCLSCALSIEDCEEFDKSELVMVKQPSKVKFKLYCFELYSKLKAWVKGSNALLK